MRAPVRPETWMQAFTRACAALRDAGLPFCLMGSLALWARTGSERPTIEDIDLGVREGDLLGVGRALRGAGFRVEVPDEDWLVKAWWPTGDDEPDVLVDLIYAPSGVDVDDELLERCISVPVQALDVRVIAATDLLVTKLLTLGPMYLDYGAPLEMARILREEVEWDALQARTAHSPYAEAFFLLARRLGIDPRSGNEDVVPVGERYAADPDRRFATRERLVRELQAALGADHADDHQ